MTIAVGSVLGARLVDRLGTRALVVAGLSLLGASFGWIAMSSTFTPYTTIVAQMALMGTGLGLTTAPATESILNVLPPAKAGIGSAVNDATREAGGTLGVAIIGSVFSSIYGTHLANTSFATLPKHVAASARDSVGAALSAAAQAPASVQHRLYTDVNASFMSGQHVACLVAAGVCLLGAAGALLLPGRRAVPEMQVHEAALAVPDPALA
jgi:MFS family permease